MDLAGKYITEMAESQYVEHPGLIHATEVSHPCDKYIWWLLRKPSSHVWSMEQKRRFAFGHWVEEYIARPALVRDGWNCERKQEIITDDFVLTPDIWAEKKNEKRLFEIKSSTDSRSSLVSNFQRLLSDPFWIYRSWINQACMYSYFTHLPCSLWVICFPSIKEFVYEVNTSSDEGYSGRVLAILDRIKRIKACGGVNELQYEPNECRACPFINDCQPQIVSFPENIAVLSGDMIPREVQEAILIKAKNAEAASEYESAKKLIKEFIGDTFINAPEYNLITENCNLHGVWRERRGYSKHITVEGGKYPDYEIALVGEKNEQAKD